MPCGTCRKTFQTPCQMQRRSSWAWPGDARNRYTPSTGSGTGRSAKFPGPPGGRLVLSRGGSDVESAVRRQQPVTLELQPGHCRGRLAEQRLRGPFRPGIPFRHTRVAPGCRAWLRVRRIEAGRRVPGVHLPPRPLSMRPARRDTTTRIDRSGLDFETMPPGSPRTVPGSPRTRTGLQHGRQCIRAGLRCSSVEYTRRRLRRGTRLA